jgi:hypothetical protein
VRSSIGSYHELRYLPPPRDSGADIITGSKKSEQVSFHIYNIPPLADSEK